MSKSMLYFFLERTFHSPSRACVPLWLEQNVKMFFPIQRLSDQLIWFVSEPQWSTVYLFTKGQRTRYLHRGLLFMWHIMLMTYYAKDIDYFSVLVPCSYVVYDTEVQGSFHGSTIFDGSGGRQLNWYLLCCIGN